MKTKLYRDGSCWNKVENYFDFETGKNVVDINEDTFWVSNGFIHALETKTFEGGEWHHALVENGDVIIVHMTERIIDCLTIL